MMPGPDLSSGFMDGSPSITVGTNTASGVAEGGVVDLNGPYRARTGDLLLAKHGCHELGDVRRGENHVPDALRTGRAYDVHVIRAIEIIQLADVADGFVAG